MVTQEQAKQRTKRKSAGQQSDAAREALQSEALQSTIAPATPPDASTSPTPAGATTRRRTSRRPRAQIARDVDLPAVAPCKDLETLRHLTPDAARHHVNLYLHTTMPTQQADDFEALTYRWELHLVELDHIHLLRQIDMNRRKLSRYRTALRKGASFPPLVALGGDGAQPTEDVMLCDGYHRIIAMRDIGLHFAWVWLAVDLWREQASITRDIPVLSGSRV
ncbi:MAG TPA: hypothetical protein VF510_15025 [Ktedonobacterales bacterium]